MTRILFLTVGTGNVNDAERTLYTPLRKSMKKDYFDYFVFLPSTETEHNAMHLANEPEFQGKSLIETLPEPLIENDSDKCFKHFNAIIEKYKNKYHSDTDDLEIDLTRGTKAMSSAIYSAGLRHGIYKYRYVTSDKRTEHGQVVSGTEFVNSFNATIGTFLSKIDQAKLFLKSYNFSAVATLFENEKNLPAEYKKVGRYIKAASEFYSAWHCLDYETALKNCPQWGEVVLSDLTELGMEKLFVDNDAFVWIQNLNKKLDYSSEAVPTKEECIERGKNALNVAIDLLANAQRQVDIGNYEDAIVRIYRIIEMIGQIYLFNHGYDTARLDSNDKNIREFIHKENIRPNEYSGHYSFAREKTAKFIEDYLDENIGKQLLNLLKDSNHDKIISQKERNNSVLIHGFNIVMSQEKEKLYEKLKKTEQALKKLLSVSLDDLNTAHKINSFKG
ncbi:MAG: TIGR02710 family CRISPR-associated protein [Alphaproteobacteria bacterium]|nr:TIGR02710 family CRISPR-associated protein [Alphaproteobacteria bacterium]